MNSDLKSNQQYGVPYFLDQAYGQQKFIMD